MNRTDLLKRFEYLIDKKHINQPYKSTFTHSILLVISVTKFSVSCHIPFLQFLLSLHLLYKIINTTPTPGIIQFMVDESQFERERIRNLQIYIRIMEKIRNTLWGFRFNPTERAALEAIDKRISWWRQIMAIAAGLALFGILLIMVRLLARNPYLLLGGILGAGLFGIATVIFLFHQARREIADQEIRIAQLEIFRLEDLINDR